MPYHYEGERLVFDARTPEAPTQELATPMPGAEANPVDPDPDNGDEGEGERVGEGEEEEQDGPVSA